MGGKTALFYKLYMTENWRFFSQLQCMWVENAADSPTSTCVLCPVFVLRRRGHLYLKPGKMAAARNAEAACSYTDKKENEIFLINKEIQMGAVAKSYMRKGFLIYEEMQKYEEAVSHIWLCNRSLLNFLIYEENSIFFFYQCSRGLSLSLSLITGSRQDPLGALPCITAGGT